MTFYLLSALSNIQLFFLDFFILFNSTFSKALSFCFVAVYFNVLDMAVPLFDYRWILSRGDYDFITWYDVFGYKIKLFTGILHDAQVLLISYRVKS